MKWAEFQFGPPLLEAVSAGAVDYGYTGDVAAHFRAGRPREHAYVGVIPARGYGQAIVVRGDSPIKTLRELVGQEDGGRQGFERA